MSTLHCENRKGNVFVDRETQSKLKLSDTSFNITSNTMKVMLIPVKKGGN